MESEMHPPVTLASLAALKGRWHVSMIFLAKRASSLNLITPNQYRYLCQQIKSNWGVSEPGDEKAVPERPVLLRKMAKMLYGDPVDLQKLSKESGLPTLMLRQLLGIEHPSGRLLEFKR
jgi:Zn-dependent peptidase ImmA (M78 family)